METQRTYKIKQVADIAKVSVRTLHHYDHIGLLQPAQRTEAGYRLYTQEDLLRLQQILLYRRQGLTLAQIRAVLDAPSFDLQEALLTQRRALLQQAKQTAAQLRAIDQALMTLQNPEKDMNENTLFEGFDPEKHAQEAQERWGHTQAWAQSKQRTAHYTKADWREVQQEQAALYQTIAQVMAQGHKPTSIEAMEQAEAHRHAMTRFYDCDDEMHVSLANLYESDARFTANLDKHAEGLASYLAAAIRANVKRSAKS